MVVANFSKNTYENYKLSVAEDGKYTQIFNSNLVSCGGNAKLDSSEITTKEEYYDGRNNTLEITLDAMSVAIYAYRPFTKEELLAIAEKKVEMIRKQLEKEALEKAEALKKATLKENLEAKVNEAQEKISKGSEAPKEEKVVRKKKTADTSAKKVASAKTKTKK